MKRRAKLIHYGSIKVTKLVLYGSLCVSFVLTSLLIGYDISIGTLRGRTIIGLVIILYLIFSAAFIVRKHTRVVSWLLILLYAALAFSTMLYWGLNAAAGIFATSFIIILSGILLGSRAIFPISICLVILLFIVQTIHNLGIISPNFVPLYDKANYIDLTSYVSMLGVFALVTWISGNQIEKTLERANAAEALVRAQKESLSIELEKESARLRETQLKELQQLYQFATLGQSAAATLHELSNHLSVLNMDIDDLKQQHRNSKAIANAKEGIHHINIMVRQIRRKLNSYDTSRIFKVDSVIRKVVKDLAEKSKNTSVTLKYATKPINKVQLTGDPLALTQILTVLLTNALEACAGLPNAEVTITLKVSNAKVYISVIDNGIGVSKASLETLFLPTLSSKPAGMGVGLYIARHLAESHFNGTITLSTDSEQTQNGTHFIVTVPLEK